MYYCTCDWMSVCDCMLMFLWYVCMVWFECLYGMVCMVWYVDECSGYNCRFTYSLLNKAWIATTLYWLIDYIILTILYWHYIDLLTILYIIDYIILTIYSDNFFVFFSCVLLRHVFSKNIDQ